MVEIDLRRHMIDRHHQALRALTTLTRQIGTDDWCLVGGLMVLAVSVEYGITPPRASVTKDADLVVNVIARPDSLRRVTQALLDQSFAIADFDLPGAQPGQLARCTFTSYAATIDLLCPDHTPEAQLDVPELGLRSIAIPGGRRALELSRLTTIVYADDADATIRIPTLHGALIAKVAAALDERTAHQARHSDDAAQLLTAINDPTELARNLSPADLELLRTWRPDTTLATLPRETALRARSALALLTLST